MNFLNLLKKPLVAVLFCCVLWNTACVNRIEEDIQESNIPITFSTKIEKVPTKATGAAFDKGDEIGLFAVLTPSDIEQKPYINNLRLACGDGSTLIPEKAVFYPEGNSTLDFISYYPYRAAGKPEGKATIPISVETDQGDSAKHSKSDFLIARKAKVASSSKAVELEYQHKLTKIKILLTPGENEKAEDMLKANPRIIATGLKTKANYNLRVDSFSEISSIDNIVAFGKWAIEEGALTGKEMIVIPQETNESNQSFIMEWNGRLYNCPIPSLSLAGGTQYEINISAMQTDTHVLQGIVGKISDWKTAPGSSTDNRKEYATIHLAALSFSTSNVYRIYHNGRPVAEVCKEFLNSDKLVSRAIVVYPVLENEKADLSQGTVLQLWDKSEPVNGGKISWDTSTNSFNYEEGSSAAIGQFYLNDKKEILLNKTDDVININIVGYTLRDIRNGDLVEYPIVKIGTQYWMRAELRATAYQDGKALSKQTAQGSNAGYFKPQDYDIYFYNGEALLAGKLNPAGWKIPSESDWEQLKSYTKGKASLLKTGQWQVATTGEVYPNTNLTQFNAYPVGIWKEETHYNAYKITGFWSWDEASQAIPQQTVFFTGESNEFISSATQASGKEYYKALSIRCIKE